MKLTKESAEIYVPDSVAIDEALGRTTHMGVSAHQDDLEIMAYDGILQCFGRADRWFLGVVVTNGAGSPRDGLYVRYTDEQMRAVRRVEQRKAAFVGEFGVAVFLDHPSSDVKDPARPGPRDDIRQLIAAARPEVVYTHNLADKHDTHVSVALRTIAAIRGLPAAARPKALYGCEVWRGLDWMVDEDKVVFNVDRHENIAMSLVGVFDSQIVGGKRYDLATMGRRRANATYHESHAVDASQMMIFAMNLTPLIENDSLDVGEYVQAHIHRLAEDVDRRVRKYS
jgi:LmbE family N-acetylglucosaminyl deacetylase